MATLTRSEIAINELRGWALKSTIGDNELEELLQILKKTVLPEIPSTLKEFFEESSPVKLEFIDPTDHNFDNGANNDADNDYRTDDNVVHIDNDVNNKNGSISSCSSNNKRKHDEQNTEINKSKRVVKADPEVERGDPLFNDDYPVLDLPMPSSSHGIPEVDNLQFITQQEIILQPVIMKKSNFIKKREYLSLLLNTPIKDMIENDLRGMAALKSTNTQKNRRNKIAHVIIDKVLEVDPSFIIPKELFTKWAVELCVLFPTDSPQLYYSESSVNEKGKPVTAGGILYNTWCYTRKDLRKAGVLASSTSKSNFQTDIDTSPGVQQDLIWLRNCAHPFSDVKEKWINTHVHRFSKLNTTYISNYLRRFSFLRGPQGYLLIEIDFNILCKDHSDKFLSKWPIVAPKIIALAKKRASANPNISEILRNHVKDDVFDNSEVIALLLLPCFLGNENLKRNKQGRLRRSTVEESQLYFILLVESDDEAVEQIELRQKHLKKLGEHIQPFVVLIGTPTKLSSCQVRIDNTTYIVPTATKAVDICFKSFLAFDVKYPEYCKYLWAFIETYIFEIEKKNRMFVTVNALISDLNAVEIDS